jgi:hypothetical protein
MQLLSLTLNTFENMDTLMQLGTVVIYPFSN